MGQILLWIFLILFVMLVLYILILTGSALFVSRKNNYDQLNKYYSKLLNSLAIFLVKIMRIKVEVTGLEKLPKERFLLICNHRSDFDPIATAYYFRKYQLAFISKPENLKIPIIGRLALRCLYMPIDRENARNAAKTLVIASRHIKNDVASVVVYPEGTRSKSSQILPFHNGVIKIAQKAESPLVIMSVAGTEKISKNFPWHSTKVYLDILETIPAQEVKARRSAELGDYAHHLMEQNLLRR